MDEKVTIVGRGVEPDELRSCELFAHLEGEELDRLAATFEELDVPAHAHLYRGGDPADALYVVRRGAVDLVRDVVGRPVLRLAHLGGAQFFGELGLLGSTHRSSAARATVPSRVLRLTKPEFHRLLETHPEIGDRLQAAAADRQARAVAEEAELGRRREVRIRLRHAVFLELDGGRHHPAVLEDLSLGGLRLSGAPGEWMEEEDVAFGLGLREGVLPLAGHVVWRRDDVAGVVLEKRSAHHDMILQLTLRMLLAASEWTVAAESAQTSSSSIS